jgi:hypothetical protein
MNLANGNRFLLLLAALLVISLSSAEVPLTSSGACVVLLHGMARTTSSMNKMQQELEGEGYFVVNQAYESRQYTIEELAPVAVRSGLDSCMAHDSHSVHFVTHSLGGILVRQYFSENEAGALGRVVMLGPPNQGSNAADVMADIPGFEWVNGPAGAQLGKGESSVPLRLGAPTFEFAVIAGDRTIDPITSAVLPNPDDGKVSVNDTKLEGMSDFALVHVSHAYIMKNDEVIGLVKEFLLSGQFSASSSDEESP